MDQDQNDGDNQIRQKTGVIYFSEIAALPSEDDVLEEEED